jgi:hypothetical protein
METHTFSWLWRLKKETNTVDLDMKARPASLDRFTYSWVTLLSRFGFQKSGTEWGFVNELRSPLIAL